MNNFTMSTREFLQEMERLRNVYNLHQQYMDQRDKRFRYNHETGKCEQDREPSIIDMIQTFDGTWVPVFGPQMR